ncbi:TonB-dependent receptor plug domain-containing protein [Flavicella marina]|uniref:TonB-dependent receptor plug domain-containing protein n=1 Tax=Flavicella marina TaxID=1475951 RepID=UPI0012651684|nr:TonB-dependent receptor [Flavicella marina]
MNICKTILILVVVSVHPVFAQQKLVVENSLDSIQKIKTVEIVATKFHSETVLGQKTVEISEAEIVRNTSNFTELLRYNSPIAFKDYGNGGTSSARFRGTSATNTVVLWNGININSVGSGQTDFNALSANTSDQIIIKSGGGSVTYGSGAIGGTVHLNDLLDFKQHQDFQLFTSYGSFNTSSNFFKANLGTGKWAVKLSGTYNSSDNDYEYIDTRYTDEDGNPLFNENGAYKNYGIDFSVGYEFSDVNKIYFFTTGYYGDRLFSDGLPNPSAGSERNEDLSQRNLLKWTAKFGGFSQQINFGYLTQEYRYYNNKDAEMYDFGRSKRFLIDYSLDYRISNVWNLKYLMLYENTNGDTNQINPKIREALSFGGMVTCKPTDSFIANISIRNENNSDFEVPLAASLSVEQKIFRSIWLKGNLSSNYRVPTYNEMYWPVVGNDALIPEKAKQGELGLEFDKFDIRLNATAFYIHIEDKIIWKPAGNTNLWTPLNLKTVVNKGAEFFLGYDKILGKHSIHFSGNYTFTLSENLDNGKALPFAPKHLVNYNIEYGYDRVKLYFQDLYQSEVFTNELALEFYSLAPVRVMNLGVDYALLQNKDHELILGGKVNNIMNEVYYFTNLRPMPGRNNTININYKF